MKAYNKQDIDYASLKQSASHYKGEKGYCSLIAFSIATGCKFGKARSKFKNIRARCGGTQKISTFAIYRAVGKQIVPFRTTSGFMISNSASRLPRIGTFLVYSASHVTCVRDGIVHDWCVEPVPTGYKRRDKRMKEVYQVLDA